MDYTLFILTLFLMGLVIGVLISLFSIIPLRKFKMKHHFRGVSKYNYDFGNKHKEILDENTKLQKAANEYK